MVILRVDSITDIIRRVKGKVKVKVKFPCPRYEGIRGNGGIALLILNLILDVDEGVCSASHLGRFTTG